MTFVGTQLHAEVKVEYRYRAMTCGAGLSLIIDHHFFWKILASASIATETFGMVAISNRAGRLKQNEQQHAALL